MSHKMMILKAKQGDQAAISELIATHQEAVFGFLNQFLSNTDDAKEVTQDSFVKAIKSLEAYSEKGEFKAWLFRIARNTALDRLRSHKRRGGDKLPLEEELHAHSRGTMETVANREDCDLAMQLVQKLPAEEREVLMLRVMENMKFKEIAEITEAPLNTVLGRMRNGTNRMKQWMKEYQ